ncbi:E3 ubiquitin-protein ligase SGR9, amyloplastic-like [Ipomoea triloba]|uniref:E3 ubiquitin-protein ligase SGR9, amyloplastic-like n=1 Tax=Ipomoea triloba TaxID=35885 RepID=UPI00125E78F5|nr:E3 ubiquitin-protein ligase SGR9, amyloplastic-like [Ipomoea triloba]
MEESSIDDYSDYLTTYSVRPYPTVGEDNAPFACAASSTHVHVRFSYHTVDDSDDGEYEVESRIICLRDEVLAEESGDDCRSFILSEGLCYWPIDAGTVLDIADEVVQKALQFKRNLRVEIRSVQIRGGSDVQETYEDYDDRDFGGADGGCVDIKSLKRKRIAYDERDCCCVICLEVLTAGTDVGVMPCSHYSFHHDCLSSWLERSPSCPLCRRKMSAVTAATAADSRS